MFESTNRRTRVRGALFVAGATIAVAILSAPFDKALAQGGPPAAVCLAKTDATGGRMRFITLEADATLFEAAGFQRFSCPALTPEIAQGQQDRCDRLRAQTPEDQASLGALYGMPVSEMCRATDAWVASQTGA